MVSDNTPQGADVLATGLWPLTRQTTSLGLVIPDGEPRPGANTPHFAELLKVSRLAAETGFEMLWFPDHFSFAGDDGLRGAWDVWTLMAAIAAAVPDVQIGPMVACTAYRNPGVIVKMSEMIDEISGGRFILGLGAGWNKPEYEQFGMRFEPRVTMFEEALEIIHRLMRAGKADVQGKHYQANNAVNLPRGPRPGGPPILIGSTGVRMLGLLAKYGDAWNGSWGGDTAGLKEKVAKVDAACIAAGRDPATVVKTIGVTFGATGYAGEPGKVVEGTIDEKVAFLRFIEALGARHLVVRFDPFSDEAVAAFAPVVVGFYSGL